MFDIQLIVWPCSLNKSITSSNNIIKITKVAKKPAKKQQINKLIIDYLNKQSDSQCILAAVN